MIFISFYIVSEVEKMCNYVGLINCGMMFV